MCDSLSRLDWFVVIVAIILLIVLSACGNENSPLHEPCCEPDFIYVPRPPTHPSYEGTPQPVYPNRNNAMANAKIKSKIKEILN